MAVGVMSAWVRSGRGCRGRGGGAEGDGRCVEWVGSGCGWLRGRADFLSPPWRRYWYTELQRLKPGIVANKERRH